ncbi:MAG: FAD-binding protein [Clostridia bacterium]|nr:FAD-binding protein [Clostridia bacterium]
MDLDVKKFKTDVLVIGGGGAGVRAALEAAVQGAEVILVSKGPVARSGVTPLAGGDLVAAVGHRNPLDNPGVHAIDLIREGRYLADHSLIAALVEDAPECVADLERYGVKFRKKGDSFFQFFSPGETYPRSMSIIGKGYGMMRALKSELKKTVQCDVFEDVIITRLLKVDNNICGAVGLDMSIGKLLLIEAKSTILATGGNLQLWPHSDTPSECTGDGHALAFYCGAELIDMEMVLYYPLALTGPESARGTLISYEDYLNPDICGGKLLNGRGEEFLPHGKPPGRDIMVQLIFKEINEGRCTDDGAVLLDLTYAPSVREKARYINEKYLHETDLHLRKVGVDLLEQPVHVAPATHYTLGGVRIDSFGNTTVEGLFAAGEVAGNVHGANRMAGNALTETQVFGRRAGAAAAERATMVKIALTEAEINEVIKREKELLLAIIKPIGGCKAAPFQLRNRLKEIMGRYVGFPRDEAGLKKAISEISVLKSDLASGISVADGYLYNLALIEALELIQMLTTAELVARSALLRTESRGHHQRRDYPETDNKAWLKHTRIRQTDSADILVDTGDVEIKKPSAG